MTTIDARRQWLNRWIYHSILYSLAVTLPSIFYQAYAIRALGFTVDEVGSLTFINISAIALGNLTGLPLVYRYRDRRVTIWKTFTSLNLLSWSLSGFTDIAGVKPLFPLSIGVAQYTGSIGGLAYSDTIADVVSRDESIRLFSRVNMFTTTAALIGLVLSIIVFHAINNVKLAYRICYAISLLAALISIGFLASLWEMSKKPPQRIGPWLMASKFKSVMNAYAPRNYVSFMLLLTFSVNLPSALWNYYLIKVFHGDETWISLGNVSSTLASILGNYVVGRMHYRMKPRRVMILAVLPISSLPLVYLFSPTLPLQILFNIYSGFSWAFFNNMSNIYNLYLVGIDDRIYFLTMLGIANNVSASIASKTGSFIASMGLEYMKLVFIASSCLRLSSFFYAVKRVRDL
ncbi:MFS transporter [Desulfurococcus amylolyticus]|uniref:MFS transporter n=1 Tax=Desulfurococcus amylolyticus TaxID=94694 RepID=UPI0023F03105|nr:MFS transporter [Desulfurococcus amylolyticus]